MLRPHKHLKRLSGLKWEERGVSLLVTIATILSVRPHHRVTCVTILEPGGNTSIMLTQTSSLLTGDNDNKP